ncbi:unnamed protein product [Closterium sp. Naga37s-1]|nr:unnamed protein product [Closterium sp. Naga37s-1]
MASDPAPSTDKWMNFLTEANLDDDTYVPGVLLPSQPALEQVACSAEGGGGNTEEGEKTGSSSRKRSRDEGAATADVSCSKANREKMRRDRLNDRFLELSRSLEPGKAPKADKASILCDAVRVLSQLRAEREALKESNAALQEQIKELKAEKHELREEKARLKAESEKLQQHVNGSAAFETSHKQATPTTPSSVRPLMQQCQQMALGTPKGAHMGGMTAPMSAPMSAPMPGPMSSPMPAAMTAAAVSHEVRMSPAKTTFLVVVLCSAVLLSAPARVSAAKNTTAPANATAPAKAAAPANATKSGNATKIGNSAVGMATARKSKGASEGKNSTCAYYGNYNANPYFGKGLTAKLPPALFGKRCGACYKVECHNDTKRCRSGKAIVTVRVVGETKTEKQLSLSAVSWSKIVQGTDTAPVHITYKRTNCVSTVGSGVRVRSNSLAEKFNIQMVGLAGSGTLIEVELSADGKKWVKLTRDGSKAVWGIAGAEAKEVVGAKKAMSVRLTAGHTLEKIILDKVIPANWKSSTLYSSKTNFKKLMAEAK